MGLTHYCDNRSAFEDAVRALEPMRRTVENHITNLASMEGYCAACDKVVEFTVMRPLDGGWVNLRESIVCPGCGLNGRGRQALSAILAVAAERRIEKAHVFERVTAMYAMLLKKGLPIQGSEFVGPDRIPGESYDVRGIEVRHEDLHRLSYGDESLDLVCHFDVLEHVADYKQALHECARVLKAGGVMIFTVPFYGHPSHQIRAERRDGEILHHLPPAYHGNPANPSEGSLVYCIPGWPLVQELREAGFAHVDVGVCYDPYQGILSDNNPHANWLMWPVLFRATKA